MGYEAIMGLEVHAQLLTRSKIFCGCSTKFGAPPNTNTCPVCLGMPGSLPVLNREAVGMAVKAALALGCHVSAQSIFARKNYFYPDLPKGYQISQYELPLAQHGQAEVYSGERSAAGKIVNRKLKKFRIHRLHLEEDAGKSVHDLAEDTLVNMNRCGVPLIEIVSEPDFRSSQEAYDYLDYLRRTLIYIGVCDGNMEEGSLRCDANVSVRPSGREAFGTKIEIKNLNSLRFVQKALDYEIQRQVQVLTSGGQLRQETRLWDENNACTYVMRSKEEAHDYRYFPEPDLLPLEIDAAWLEEIRARLPELPEAKRARFVSQYHLSDDSALFLTYSPFMADYFERAWRVSGNAIATSNWIMGDLTRDLKVFGREIDESPVSAENLGVLVKIVGSGQLSTTMAKQVFEEMFKTGESPESVVQRTGMAQISDEAELQRVIRRVMESNREQVQAYRGGKIKLLGFFVGQVMKETRGQANPEKVNHLLKRELESS
ncbi:MAG: Asp-tRNA(Asn)/Glu-tRNA(Gln) amidotransferase subunit GatB [Acidobacteria bacterium]|nr:Asp-tRNA(Asn)/Glu-tRNA(Gln) amidotransferase subunit GatB [Acidobacteriota bacterium]